MSASEPTAARGLAEFIGVRAPGATPLLGEDIESERLPEALIISRTRDVAVPWATLLSGAGTSSRTGMDLFKARIEATWGGLLNPKDLVANYLVDTAAQPMEKRIEQLVPPAKSEPIPPEAVVLQHGRLSRSYYALIPKPGKQLDFKADYEGSWSGVDSCWTVFPVNKGLNDPINPFLPMQPTRALAMSDTGLPWNPEDPKFRIPLPDKWKIIDLYGISQLVDKRLARQLLENSWVATVNDDILKDHLSQAKAGEYKRLNKDNIHLKLEKQRSNSLQISVERDCLEDVNAGEWILKFGGRHYCLHPRVTGLDLLSSAGYESAWKSGMAIEVVHRTQEADPLPFMHALDVDLHVENIVDMWREANAEKKLADELSTVAENIKKKLEDFYSLTDDELRMVEDRYKQAKKRQKTADSILERLQTQARQLGYFLALANGPAKDNAGNDEKDENDKPIVLTEGHLYQRSQRLVTWTRTEDYIAIETVRVGPVLLPLPVPRQRTVYEQRTAVKYREIVPDQPQWLMYFELLQQAGYYCFVLTQTDTGYTAQDGTGLRDIIGMCEANELFRRRVALFVPQYQQKLTGGFQIKSYRIIVRPLPGYSPISFPSLYLEEDSTYRIAWRGVELGELLTSVSLAPGESRRIEVSRQFSRKVERVQSVSSALDVTSGESEELSASIENTARNENETTNSINWNVRAGAQIGPVNLGGSVGGSSNKSAKSFAQSINKTASKAARDLRSTFKQEVRTSTTESTSILSDDKVSSQITNINLGSTLNLLFYQLNNIYESAMILDDLRFVYRPSTELVEGTGLQDLLTFSFSQCRAFVDLVANDPFFELVASLANSKITPLILARHVLTVLLHDYFDEVTKLHLPDGGNSSVTSISTGDRLTEDELAYMESIWRPEDPAAPVPKLDPEFELGLITGIVSKLDVKGHPISPTALVTPSKASYVDAVLGALPATEQYSEDMRLRERLLKDAEIRERNSQAAIKEAQALRIRGNELSKYRLAEPVLMSASLSAQGDLVAFVLSKELPAGSWMAKFGDHASVMLPSGAVGKTTVEVQLPVDLSGKLDAALVDSSVLVELTTGVYIAKKVQ